MLTRLDLWLVGVQPCLRVIFSAPREIRKHLSFSVLQLKGRSLVLTFEKIKLLYLD